MKRETSSAKRGAHAAFVAASLLLAGGCAGPLSTLEPAGPSAQAMALLWYFILILTGTIFLLMFAVLLVAALRPEWLRIFSPRQLIVWGGLVMPGVGLVALVGFAVYLGEQLIPKADAGDVVNVEVTAARWHWNFRYPDAPDGVAAASRHVLHIPAGREIHLSITSEDVIHSFWVPRLAGKIDAIPGHVNVLRLQADVPGIYARRLRRILRRGARAHGAFTVEAHARRGLRAPPSGPSPKRAGGDRTHDRNARARQSPIRLHKALVEIWDTQPGFGRLVGRQSYHGRPALHGDGVRLLHHRRRAGHADPRAARDAAQRLRRTPRPTTRSSPCTAR